MGWCWGGGRSERSVRKKCQPWWEQVLGVGQGRKTALVGREEVRMRLDGEGGR
jgi:hypothetical protein